VFPDNAFVYIPLFDALHIGFDIIGDQDLLCHSYLFATPVKVSVIHGNVKYSGKRVKTRFPVFCGFARAFRGYGKVDGFLVTYSFYGMPGKSGSFTTVNRDGSRPAQQAPERPYENITLDQYFGVSSDPGIKKEGDYKIPHRSMWYAQNNAFGHGDGFSHKFPSHDAGGDECADFLLDHWCKGIKK